MDKKTITLKEWHDFNSSFDDYSRWIVCLMKNGSYKKDDTILECTIDTEHAVKLFGNCEMKKFMTGKYPGTENNGIRILIWEPKETEVK